MSLKQKILEDLKKAMKEKDQSALDALRLLSSSFKNKEIAIRPKTLSPQDELATIQKIAKQMKESMEEFEKAKREDLLEKERKQFKIIEKYLPKALSEKEILETIDQVIKKQEASSMKQMASVMKELNEIFKGRADNKMVSQEVRKKLS